MEDLDHAIQKKEQAVQSTPVDHPNDPGILNNLENALQSWFERTGSMEDLDRTIQQKEQAVESTSVYHPDHAMYVNNLGNALQSRFERTRSMEGHTGIPCCHFFAIMQHFPDRHGFNVSQIHPHWHNPFARECCLNRPWVFLNMQDNNGQSQATDVSIPTSEFDTRKANNPTPSQSAEIHQKHLRSTILRSTVINENVENKDSQNLTSSQPLSRTDSYDAIETVRRGPTFEHLCLTPPQNRSAYNSKKEYVQMTGLMEKLMKMTNSPEHILKFRNLFQMELASIAEKRHLAQSKSIQQTSDTSQSVELLHGQEELLDPLPNIRRGRKQSKRIESSLEQGAKKRRKISKEKQE